MIEVNLFSVPASQQDYTIGKSVSRTRFDKDTLGVSVMEFVKGFIKDNLDSLENPLGNADLVAMINSETIGWSTKDFMSLKYLLRQVGYDVTIWNVADDEENASGVPSGDIIEWNIIDETFVQNDYPTTTKIIPSQSQSIQDLIRNVVEQSGLFDPNKFNGTKNPFSVLLGNLDHEVSVSGRVNSAIISQIYSLLGQMGISIFFAESND